MAYEPGDEDPHRDALGEVPEFCDLTGDDKSECDCGDCYYERHGEPKPFRCCDGVGGHTADCELNPRWDR
jgi:hypothetical protein